MTTMTDLPAAESARGRGCLAGADMLHLLSLGAGVQSSTLALMAAAGEISPMPAAAIFADTKGEPSAVYRWLDWLEAQLPFPVHRICKGDLEADSLKLRVNEETGKPYYKTIVPFYVQGADTFRGILSRNCTYDYKVLPLIRFARAEMKRTGAATVTQWIGISLDETRRMKPSRDAKIINRWPLVEMRMSRWDCLRWMRARSFPEPPKSACVFCPFHSDAHWRAMKEQSPADFARAVAYEKGAEAAQRAGGGRNSLYLHDSLVPLDQVDFSTDIERGQGAFALECEGMCGV